MIANTGDGALVEFLTSLRTFEAKKVVLPTKKRTVHDVTHLRTQNVPSDSTKTYREKLAGRVIDGGQVTLTCHFDPAQTTPVLDGVESVRITYPLSPGKTVPRSIAFDAIASEEAHEVEVDSVTMWQITLDVTGRIAETVES